MAAKKKKKLPAARPELELILMAHQALTEIITSSNLTKISIWEARRRRAKRPEPAIATEALAALSRYLEQTTGDQEGSV